MDLNVEPALIEWLSVKNKDTITVDVIASRASCGGCAFTEALIYYGKPKDKMEKYLLLNQEDLYIYVAKVLEKKTDHITLYLKGSLFKRIALKGYETESSYK